MLELLALAAGNLGATRSLYAIPLIVVISLVYSASRHEMPERIIRRAARLALTMLAFMAVVLLVLMLLSRGL